MNGRCCAGRAPLRSRPCTVKAAPGPVAPDRTLRVVVRAVSWRPQASRTLVDTYDRVRLFTVLLAAHVGPAVAMDRNQHSSCTHETRLFACGGGVAVRVSRRVTDGVQAKVHPPAAGAGGPRPVGLPVSVIVLTTAVSSASHSLLGTRGKYSLPHRWCRAAGAAVCVAVRVRAHRLSALRSRSGAHKQR